MAHIINIFILLTIGMIFLCDAIFAYIGKDTISGEINRWVNKSKTNLAIFLSIVVTICVHFIFGSY